MNQLLWICRFAFGCNHNMSRVFTLKRRTYQVCFKCGQEFDYSWALMHTVRGNVRDAVYVSLNSDRHAEARVM
jgi:hypothetical protein